MDYRNVIKISSEDLLERFELNVGNISRDNKFDVLRCVLCENKFPSIENFVGPNCPKCNSRPRTRTLYILSKIIDAMSLEKIRGGLLAFAKTGLEGKIVDPLFEENHSASLFGEYSGKNHKTGVDVRNLDDYENEVFSGVFGCLLFDYFVEHSKALSEIHRVLRPGGLFFTHIARKRLVQGLQEPTQVGDVRAGEGSFEYLGSNRMPSVSVGIDWFEREMEKRGFISCNVRILDLLSEQEMVWFLGEKKG